MASIEEKVEERYKGVLDDMKVRHFGKTEKMNDLIEKALRESVSKSGNDGGNYPDIRLMLGNHFGRHMPVMIEAKGSKNKLEKLTKDGDIELVSNGKNPRSAITNFAVNGAVHYGLAVLDGGDYDEVIVAGINGTTLDAEGHVMDPECKAYYISEKNKRVPKLIERITASDWSLFKAENADVLFDICDKMNLTDQELETLTRKTEETLEERIKAIHQSIYDDVQIKTALSTNDKLYLFCGLIMAGLKATGTKPLDAADLTGNDNERNNDGIKLLNQIEAFLYAKNCSDEKVEMIRNLLQGVFRNKTLWKPNNGVSILRTLFKQVKTDIIPCLESNLHLDFTGKILNSLNDWVSIDNDRANDVVLTPRYVTTLMAKLARTDMNSFVWDKAMGSAGFLVSAMDIMLKDASARISDQADLAKKVKHIKENQLLGIEILGIR